jgi:hypothetical protein
MPEQPSLAARSLMLCFSESGSSIVSVLIIGYPIDPPYVKVSPSIETGGTRKSGIRGAEARTGTASAACQNCASNPREPRKLLKTGGLNG